MAGIKLLEKKPEHLNYVINELLKPGVRAALFDDMAGIIDITILVNDPGNLVYGIFEKGHPVPIGCVIVEGVRPFRGCEVHAAIFKPENRAGHKMTQIAAMVRGDLVNMWHLHYAQARCLSENVAARATLEALGFTKVGTKPGNVVSGGEYKDVDEYYIVLDGDKLPNVVPAAVKKEG